MCWIFSVIKEFFAQSNISDYSSLESYLQILPWNRGSQCSCHNQEPAATAADSRINASFALTLTTKNGCLLLPFPLTSLTSEFKFYIMPVVDRTEIISRVWVARKFGNVIFSFPASAIEECTLNRGCRVDWLTYLMHIIFANTKLKIGLWSQE